MSCNSRCIYLSPSTQDFNPYVNGGNEEEYMNLVADSMENYLRENGICFTRNNPQMSVADIVNASNSGDYALHLALHSNAAGEGSSGEIRGTEVYYYPNSNKGGMLAEIIADNFKSISPTPDRVTTKPTYSFGEVRRTSAPSVLVEIAYHDNEEDATWIKNNIDEIARNLTLSVKEFIDEVCECPRGNIGEVITMGGNLNVRSAPNVNSAIIDRLPKGTIVEILDCVGKWYKIKHNSTEGFAFRHYISV